MTNETRRERATALTRRVLPVAVAAVTGVVLFVADALVRASGFLPGDDVLPDNWGWLCVVLVLLQAAALWWRLDRPRLTFAVVTALDIALLVITLGELSVGSLAVTIAAYTLWRELGARRSIVWLVVAGILSTAASAILLPLSGTIPIEWSFLAALVRAILTFGAPAVVADLVLSRFRMLEALRDRAAIAEREQERMAQDAVQQERALMARELHDIAAHHLSGIILGAQAAGALVTTEPDRAHEYINTVRDEAQRTLANLRLTVGLLRPDGEGELTPVPSIEQIPELVDSLRAGGMRVDLESHGEPVPLGPLAEVAAYRMVQESLTNARVHAPSAPCTVTVRYGADAAELTVVNAPPPATPRRNDGTGNGLLGMRERAALVNATLTTGPTPDGGWSNRLEIPYPEEGQGS